MVSKSGHCSYFIEFDTVGAGAAAGRGNKPPGSGWRRGLIASVVSMVAVVAHTGAALAAELTDWGYDSQTRAINVVLPTTVAPSLSVLAPNQLLIELPETQISEIATQSVGDGVVESIVLEQTTPETVWMVVEFAPGTVLADVQNATQTRISDGLRQWQVEPALVASRRTVATPIATRLPGTAAAGTGSAADSLRSPSENVAQAGDFSDLPVLEPAMPMNEPVSVPPLDAVPPTIEAMPIEIPVISEADPLVDEAAADEIAADEAAAGEMEMAADEAVTPETAALPFEPPFIGGVNDGVTREPVVEVPEIAAPAGHIAELPPREPGLNVPTAGVDPAPVVEIPVQSITPNNVDRWPEPVPFGQPLP